MHSFGMGGELTVVFENSWPALKIDEGVIDGVASASIRKAIAHLDGLLYPIVAGLYVLVFRSRAYTPESGLGKLSLLYDSRNVNGVRSHASGRAAVARGNGCAVRASARVSKECTDSVSGFRRENVLELTGLLFNFCLVFHAQALGE